MFIGIGKSITSWMWLCDKCSEDSNLIAIWVNTVLEYKFLISKGRLTKLYPEEDYEGEIHIIIYDGVTNDTWNEVLKDSQR